MKNKIRTYVLFLCNRTRFILTFLKIKKINNYTCAKKLVNYLEKNLFFLQSFLF